MKLPVDMNLSPRWVSILTDAGFQAAHWSTIGASNAPDSLNLGLNESPRRPASTPGRRPSD
ncbi:MAG TPA: hypothetical protein DCE18_03035 [Syntrophobacteraceae bacterium]|nr:hypothetical protein [Syntrophobacteraceae bacterium]HBZ56609.1 hypothetical protein [Syntrophobacteraceae bacterium]